MKKLQFALISLIIISSIGCTSTPVQGQDTSVNSPSNVESNKKKEGTSSSSKNIYFINKQTNKKLRIEDWKYMGFGEALPSWVVPALENDIGEIKKAVPELENKEIEILIAPGCNQDQAERGLADLEKPSGYELYKSFWVRVSDSKNKEKLDVNYISIALYYKNILES